MKIVRWALIALAVVVAGVFTVNNRHPVAVDLWPFPFQLEIRLVLLLLMVLFLGFLIGYLTRMMGGIGRRHRRAPPAASSEPRETGASRPHKTGVPARTD